MHLVPALFGALTIIPVYLIGREIFDSRTGVLSAFLAALSPILLFYSQEAKQYGVFLFFAAFSCWCFLKTLVDNSIKAWCLYSAFLIICLLIHLNTVQILIVYTLHAALRSIFFARGLAAPKSRPAWTFNFIWSSALGCAVGGGWLLTRPSPATVAEGGLQTGHAEFLGKALLSLGPAKALPLDFGSLETAVPALAMLLIAGLGLSDLARRKREFAAFFVLFLCVPLTIMYFTLGPKALWPWERYVSHIVPVYLVAVAAGFIRLCRMTPGKLGITLAGVLCLSVHSTALRDWAVEARMDHGWLHREQLEEIRAIHREAGLQGVIFTPYTSQYADETARILQYFGCYGRDLPVPLYYLSAAGVYEVDRVLSRGKIAEILVRSSRKKDTLSMGKYVLISRTRPSCELLAQSIGSARIAAADPKKTAARVALCEVSNQIENSEQPAL